MESENELNSIIFIGTFLMLFLAFGLLFMVLFYQRHLAKIKKRETELLLKTALKVRKKNVNVSLKIYMMRFRVI